MRYLCHAYFRLARIALIAHVAIAAWCLLSFTACESVLGLDEFSVVEQTDGGQVSGRSCMTHADCASAGAELRCVAARKRCAALHTPECAAVAGPDRDDRAIWIGVLAPSSGADASASAARRASAGVAIDAINATGGVRLYENGTGVHPLVLIACDTDRDVSRAADHLMRELAVRAIVGPDDRSDAVVLTTKLAIPNDTLVVLPTATATRIADLLDDDLVWSMVPNDAQRAPWLLQQLLALETKLHQSRLRAELKLGILVPEDAQGQSVRASLSALTFNGKPLTDALNLGAKVRIDAYPADLARQATLVDAYLMFEPDVVLVLGAADAVTRIVAPLEEQWTAMRSLASPRPEYVFTDAAKVPELLELVARNPNLSTRVRGVGATYVTAAHDVHAALVADYERRAEPRWAGVSGVDSTFDAVNAIALAIHAPELSGRALAANLRLLSRGEQPVDVRADQLAVALERAARAATGAGIRVMGSLGPLAWDDRGSRRDGALEVWCVANRSGRVEFASSIWRADLPGDPPLIDADCASDAQSRSDPTNVSTPVPISTAPASAMPAADDAAQPDSPGGAPQSEPPRAPDAAAEPPKLPPERSDKAVIPCGERTCDASRDEYCCVATAGNLEQAPAPSDFSCVSGSNACAIALHCTSDTDCAQGLVCCGITNTTQCVPEPMCAAKAGTRLACEARRDCDQGQVCCAHLAPGAASYASIACEANCNPLERAVSLCESDADCTLAVPGSCLPSRVIPNLKICALP